jgi:hypothetical protein
VADESKRETIWTAPVTVMVPVSRRTDAEAVGLCLPADVTGGDDPSQLAQIQAIAAMSAIRLTMSD